MTSASPAPGGQLLARWRKVYGASPLHLLALIACFALIGYAVHKAYAGPLPERMGVWFVASFIAHDFVLYPLYALVDRSLQAVVSRLPRRTVLTGRDPLTVNAVRVPLALSVLLLVVFQGPIRHQGDVFYYNASGLHEIDYFGRWLIATGVLFAISAVSLAVHLGRVRRVSLVTAGVSGVGEGEGPVVSRP